MGPDPSRARAHWVCPRCGARLVARNMAHACGPYSVESFLAGKGPQARALFDAFHAAVKRAAGGDVTPAPAKTRVAFMARIRFASVNAVSDRGLSAHVVLHRRHPSPRFRRIEEAGRGWFVHHFRIEDPAGIDDEVVGFLRESYERVGR